MIWTGSREILAFPLQREGGKGGGGGAGFLSLLSFIHDRLIQRQRLLFTGAFCSLWSWTVALVRVVCGGAVAAQTQVCSQIRLGTIGVLSSPHSLSSHDLQVASGFFFS